MASPGEESGQVNVFDHGDFQQNRIGIVVGHRHLADAAVYEGDEEATVEIVPLGVSSRLSQPAGFFSNCYLSDACLLMGAVDICHGGF
ncbi:hypothetical protein ACFX15_007936 [Malus domestica]